MSAPRPHRRIGSLPSGVWLLGAVSLLNDVASEAIYPLLPFFLTAVLGATAVSLGVIEGAAEAVSSVLKVVSGTLSDRWRRRKPIVIFGLLAVRRRAPVYQHRELVVDGLCTAFSRSRGQRNSRCAARCHARRFCRPHKSRKGLRLSPRDGSHGRHRRTIARDAFLLAFPNRYRTLFALTAIPGIATVLLLLWVKEREHPHAPSAPIPHPQSLIPETRLPRALVRYLIVLSIFTLGNSTDAFLLLRLTEAAGGPQMIPIFWSLLHVVKMTASLVCGAASDHFGRRPLIAAGWVVYAIVYAGFAVSTSLSALLSWFFIYGLYYGCVEGTERALVADFARAGAAWRRLRHLQCRSRNRRAGIECRIWADLESRTARRSRLPRARRSRSSPPSCCLCWYLLRTIIHPYETDPRN